jgi:hypothetical protein
MSINEKVTTLVFVTLYSDPKVCTQLGPFEDVNPGTGESTPAEMLKPSVV